MQKIFKIILIPRAVFILISLFGCTSQSEKFQKTYLSDALTVTSVTPHMQGPESIKKYPFPTSKNNAKYIWITAASVKDVKNPEGKTKNLCHVFVQEISRNQKNFGRTMTNSGLHFVLGMNQKKINLPKGFGVPVSSGGPMKYTSSLATHSDFRNGNKATEQYALNLIYTQNEDTKPLHRISLTTLIPIGTDSCVFGTKNSTKNCNKVNSISSSLEMTDAHNQVFTPHFYVPPGKHIITTEVTNLLNLKNNTAIHYISTHIHHGVTKLRLLEGESKQLLYQVKTHSGHHHVHTPVYSSVKGLPIKAQSKYFLEVTVDNKTSKPIDIMASLHLYLYDTQFRRHKVSSPFALKH